MEQNTNLKEGNRRRLSGVLSDESKMSWGNQIFNEAFDNINPKVNYSEPSPLDVAPEPLELPTGIPPVISTSP